MAILTTGFCLEMRLTTSSEIKNKNQNTKSALLLIVLRHLFVR